MCHRELQGWTSETQEIEARRQTERSHLLALLGVILARWGKLENRGWYLWIMVLAIPLPYIAGQLGWIVAELGRQPWIVYGLLKTSDAVSRSVSTAQVVGSLAGFTLLYGTLGVVDIYLLARYARKGPDDDLSAIIKPAVKEV